jgi:hypothetical protein
MHDATSSVIARRRPNRTHDLWGGADEAVNSHCERSDAIRKKRPHFRRDGFIAIASH